MVETSSNGTQTLARTTVQTDSNPSPSPTARGDGGGDGGDALHCHCENRLHSVSRRGIRRRLRAAVHSPPVYKSPRTHSEAGVFHRTLCNNVNISAIMQIT